MLMNKYDFVMFFDVKNGNPNGDPDAGNMPRMDAETGHGKVTDGCIKHKIRHWIDVVREGQTGFRILEKTGNVCDEVHSEAYANIGIDDAVGMSNDALKRASKAKRDAGVDVDKEVVKWLCANFYDVRTFGSVLTTMQKGGSDGKLVGPVQLSMAESVEPIVPSEVAITRCALAKGTDRGDKTGGMGSKYIVPYALYRAHGHISVSQANLTGFDEDDLELLWDAIINMFEEDHSALRGEMSLRKLIIFKHSSKYGNCPVCRLNDAVSVSRNPVGAEFPARSYKDYVIEIDRSRIPDTVTVEER